MTVRYQAALRAEMLDCDTCVTQREQSLWIWLACVNRFCVCGWLFAEYLRNQ